MFSHYCVLQFVFPCCFWCFLVVFFCHSFCVTCVTQHTQHDTGSKIRWLLSSNNQGLWQFSPCWNFWYTFYNDVLVPLKVKYNQVSIVSKSSKIHVPNFDPPYFNPVEFNGSVVERLWRLGLSQIAIDWPRQLKLGGIGDNWSLDLNRKLLRDRREICWRSVQVWVFDLLCHVWP